MQEWKKDRIYYNLSQGEKDTSYNEFLREFFDESEHGKYTREIAEKELFSKKTAKDWAITGIGLASLYALIRKYKPKTIVETGVHYGLSTTIFLNALKENDKGKLISIDACSQHPDKIGCYVPEELKDRWLFIKGKSQDVLPKLDLQSIDMFVHDSDHCYKTMTFEYEWAVQKVNKGFIVTHDIGASNAFYDFAKKYKFKIYLIKTSRNKQFGLGIVKVDK